MSRQKITMMGEGILVYWSNKKVPKIIPTLIKLTVFTSIIEISFIIKSVEAIRIPTTAALIPSVDR